VADTIAFDKNTFQLLIIFMTDCKRHLDEQILTPTAGLQLDASLNSYLKPGSTEWPVVNSVLEAAGKFGEMTHEQLVNLSKEWGDFIEALKDAMKALEDGNDLAAMSASEFLEEYPGLISGGTGGFGGGGGR
jgi:hypothetical protein